MSGTVVDRGLEGVVVGETVLSNVEGEVGRLTFRGYDIDELAPKATYEEVVYLLFHGELPDHQKLAEFEAALAAQRTLPPEIIKLLRDIPRDAWPMDVLRTAVSALAHVAPHKPSGQHASDVPAGVSLIARVTASTNADVYCAITTAISTLTGELHGGAPSQVQDTLNAVGTPDKAEDYVRGLLANGKRVMGMGHREYKIRDPRARHLEEVAKTVGGETYLLARALEDAANKVLQEVKPGRRIYANVDFYTAPVLGGLGIPSDEFTCLFACSRIAGWTAHVFEQYAHNRLIRPQATYVGPAVHPYETMTEREAHAGSAT
jgi:citrate synthase